MNPHNLLLGTAASHAANMRERWLNGDRAPVEDYVRAHHDLAESPDAVQDLIYFEYCLRLELGESPEPGEYLQRFPQFAALLRKQFELHAAMQLIANAHASRFNPSHPEDPQPAPSTSMPTLPGYEFIGLLGEGGMGVVYKARNLALDRVEAVKFIKAGTLAGPNEVKRFLREARAAAKLEHSGIVPVFSVGTHDDQPYYTMAFIDGKSLADRLETGRMLPREAAELIRLVALAIHTAHAQQIIHRDLKPANILIDSNGNPHVADFGVAKLMDIAENHTQSDQIIGTPGYMAPEQIGGLSGRIGPATDVYALGATLYYTLVRHPPFQTINLCDAIRQVQEDEPVPPRRLDSGIPRDLETICLKCLEKQPEHRYSSAEQLADDLRRYLHGEPIQARPISRVERIFRWCKKNPLAASVVAFAVIASTCGPVFLAQIRASYESHGLIEQLLTTETHGVPLIIERMRPYRRWIDDSIARKLNTSPSGLASHQKLNLQLAMLPVDPCQSNDIVRSLNECEPQDLAAAVQVLCEYAPKYHSVIMERLLDADSAEFRALMPTARNQRAAAVARCREALSTTIDNIKHKNTTQHILATSRQANAVIALYQMDEPQNLWQLLEISDDGTLNDFLINRIVLFGSSPRYLLDEVTRTQSDSLRRQLLLILAQFDRQLIKSVIFESGLERISSTFLTWYVETIDAGVHSAVGLVLRRWGYENELHSVDKQLIQASPDEFITKRWHLSPAGHTMVRITNPGSFEMGSLPNEKGRQDGPPEEHRTVTIDYDYAIAAYETSREQFEQYKHVMHKQEKNGRLIPATDISWHDAAGYCNWLSESDGIAEDQRCYRPTADGSLRAADDVSALDGYRLPTEAEWEFACRGGTMTARFNGISERYLRSYGWHARSFEADNEITVQPIGVLFPNSWGLFDIYGNVVEWCHAAESTRSTQPPEGFAPLRGGSYGDTPDALRSAAADFGDKRFSNRSTGFRVARTIRRDSERISERLPSTLLKNAMAKDPRDLPEPAGGIWSVFLENSR